MIVLIEGLGSIASRHIDALLALIPEVKIYALRSGKGGRNHPNVYDITDLAKLESVPDFIIISNPSVKHYESIEKYLTFEKPLFIEKPSLTSLKQVDYLLNSIQNRAIKTYVACNLRFLPIIEFLKKEFDQNPPLELRCYSGSYLPDWRPGTNYKTSYSASKMLGGGVHLDLIHELDYVYYFFGAPNHVYSHTDTISNLGIESEDYAHYHLIYEKTMVSVTLNYFRKAPKREIEVTFNDQVWLVNLLNSTVTDLQTGQIVFRSEVTIRDTYLSQMRYFLEYVNGKAQALNSFEESIEVLKICLNESA